MGVAKSPRANGTSLRDRKLVSRYARTMIRVMRKLEVLALDLALIDEIEMALSEQVRGTIARLRLQAERRRANPKPTQSSEVGANGD